MTELPMAARCGQPVTT